MATQTNPTNPSSSLAANTLFSAKGLVVLITGGGTGIGYMLAKALVENGATRVFITGRREAVLSAAAASLGSAVTPIACDVTSPSSLQAAASAVSSSATPYLNLLVCNAGVGGPQVAAPAKDGSTSLEDWAAANLAHGFESYARTFEVNSASVWYTAMAFLPLLGRGNELAAAVGGPAGERVKQSSQIIVTSSIAGFNKMAPGGYAYGQSKAAVNLLVKQLSVVLPKWNIRVNSICPGLFPSEMSAPIVELYGSPAAGDDAAVPREMVPLGRMGDEQDMAGAILYLASRAGAYCNGNVLVVDGGRLGNFPSIN